ncbi:MAG: hypothetical protein ACRDTE_10270 [Pseudonocardiaceae bacterium]
MRNVIDELNDSADNTQRTSEEFRQLFDHVRTSVIEIRSELAQVKEEADTIRDKYNTESKAARGARDKDRGKQRRPRLMSDKWFSDTRKVPPAVIAEHPDCGDEHDDNEPPWLRDGKYYD